MFLDNWKNENYSYDFRFASHFMQEEVWISRALCDVGIEFDSARIADLSRCILECYRARLREALSSQDQLPLIRDLMHGLSERGVRILVASNDREYATPAMLEWSGLLPFVEGVYTSEGLSRRYPKAEKPHMEFFWAWAELSGISPGQYDRVIYIGDSEDNDIRPVSAIGMKTVRVFITYHKHSYGSQGASILTAADAVVRSYDELMPVVYKLIDRR